MNTIKDFIPSFQNQNSRLKLKVLLRDNFQCQYCKKRITLRSSVMDHAIPLEQGGTSTFLNLRACCQDCHLEKGAKTEREYRIWKVMKRKAFYTPVTKAG